MVTLSVVQHNVVWLQINLQEVLMLELGEGVRHLEHQIPQYFLRQTFLMRRYKFLKRATIAIVHD